MAAAEGDFAAAAIVVVADGVGVVADVGEGSVPPDM